MAAPCGASGTHADAGEFPDVLRFFILASLLLVHPPLALSACTHLARFIFSARAMGFAEQALGWEPWRSDVDYETEGGGHREGSGGTGGDSYTQLTKDFTGSIVMRIRRGWIGCAMHESFALVL